MESTRFAGFKTGFLSTPSPKKNPKSPVETRENTTPDFAGFKTGFLLSPSPKKTQKSPVETRENTTPDMAILNKLNMFYVADPEGIRENISYNKSWYCASFIDILMSDVETEDIKVFPSNTLLEIREIAQQRARFVFIPLNVNYEGQVKPGSENHWVAIIIDRTNHQLFCLDPAAKVSAASLPANVSDFIIKNNYDVQFNTTNFQISEKKGEYGLIHCGPYTVEIFNKFKENLHIQQINLEAMLSAIAPASGEEGIDEVVINKIRRSHVTRVRELISNYANNPDLPKIDIVGKSFESLTDPLPKVTTFLEALYEQKFCWEKKYSNEARKLIEENAAEPLQKGVEFDKLNRKDHATKKSMPINIPFITPEVEPSDNLLENRASFLEGHLPYEVRIKRDLFWKFSNYCKDRAINEKLNNPKRLEEQVQENLDNRQWIRNRLDEYQQFADNLGLGRQELCHPTTMEDFLKKEVNWLYIGKISNLSLFHKEALQNAWVREQITNNMLSFPQFALSTPYGCNAFCNPTIQRFLEKEENRQYFSHVSVFSKEAEKALANAWVMDRIADGTLTFQQVAGVSPGGSKILRNPLVQNFFTKEENWLYIG
ncbi:MAG: hypothetical protein K0R24_2270, partial [Gammaproteobacteria bacterium]|nr:hypothetical protein [Gammaproteobacteria bacterium]